MAVWVAVTLALCPQNRLGDAIAERSPDDLGPICAETPSELAALVAAVYSFMGWLGKVLYALRNFTGNASHQLRTPLSVVRTQRAQAARAGTQDDARAMAAKGDAAVSGGSVALGPGASGQGLRAKGQFPPM